MFEGLYGSWLIAHSSWLVEWRISVIYVEAALATCSWRSGRSWQVHGRQPHPLTSFPYRLVSSKHTPPLERIKDPNMTDHQLARSVIVASDAKVCCEVRPSPTELVVPSSHKLATRSM